MNNPLTQRQSFIDWRNSQLTISYFPPTWSDLDLEFDWKHTVQIDEVPRDDAWDSYTTEWKYQLEELHIGWGYSKEITTHYMSIRPELNENLKSILSEFGDKTFSYNMLKLTPGHMLAWHFDSYATFINKNPIPQNKSDSIKRTAVLLTEWNFGHVIQIGERVLASWKRGEAYTWLGDTWHGACNFGNTDMIVMQVTYVE